jgi:cobalt-zinc-cadmium efflux system membrane fusion protein
MALCVLPAWPHGGEDHGDSPLPPLVQAGQAPRAEAQTDDFELVAVLTGADTATPLLTLYLDRFDTNEPVPDATIEVESGAFKATAKQVSPGVYSVPGQAWAKPGRYPLTISVESAVGADLLGTTLQYEAPVAKVAAAQPLWRSPWAWGAGVVLLLTVIVWVVRRRSARAALLLAVSSTLAQAHGGEDHGDAPHAPTAVVAVSHTTMDASAPQRQPDGSLWVPKPVQRRLGLVTLLAQAQSHAVAVEFNGHVLPDPNAGGRVQATQAGRIEAGPQGLPVLGQSVVKGQVLAYLRPATSSLERGNQQSALADIEAQYAVAERKASRYAQLEGAVPQKDIEAARFERDALRKRRAAIGGSLGSPEALLAPVTGTLVASNVVIGQVVDAKELLFEVVNPSRLMVEALAYDPALTQGLSQASAAVPGGTLALQFVGGGRQLRDQAMPLLFKVQPTTTPVAIGQTLKVTASTAQIVEGVAVPMSALGRNAAGDTVVWLHKAPERFAPQVVRTQPLDARTVVITSGLHVHDRVVTEGASLLAQVR